MNLVLINPCGHTQTVEPGPVYLAEKTIRAGGTYASTSNGYSSTRENQRKQTPGSEYGQSCILLTHSQLLHALRPPLVVSKDATPLAVPLSFKRPDCSSCPAFLPTYPTCFPFQPSPCICLFAFFRLICFELAQSLYNHIKDQGGSWSKFRRRFG